MKKPTIRNILVPIDFSEMSIQAIEAAENLACRFGARIYLVHVQDATYPAGFMAPTPMMTGDVIAIHHENEKSLRKRLRDLAARLDLSPDDCRVLTTAPAFDAICGLARELSIDLIVMPTHGRTGLKHLFLGSTAERVVQHSPAPVFVVRKRGGGLNTILVPIDFSGCSLDALKYAIKFAEKVAAKIIVIHAVHLGYAYTSDGYAMYDLSQITKTLRKDAERQMREFVRAAKFGSVKFETAIRVGPAVEEICAFAKGEDVDLIITATHGRTGFKHVLIGSIAENVVRHADRPVLVVPSRPKIRATTLSKRARPARIGCGIHRGAARVPNQVTTARRSREPIRHPFPERRNINKFRESHSF
jgi:nucleotide-binding universal stress UspA family protein